MDPSDIVRIIDCLNVLHNKKVREATRTGILHKFGVELESRRKLDFDIGVDSKSGHDQIEMYYEDPLREIERFQIGTIDVEKLPELIKTLKEAVVEYGHIINKWILLGEQ